MSYILIDRDKMRITHKHPSREVLHALSWIECTNAGAVVSLSNIRPLSKFTDLELLTIYRNATGILLRSTGLYLAQAVFSMAVRLPDFDCVPSEVFAQRETISDGDKSTYSYLKGSMTPKDHESVFDVVSLRTDRNSDEEELANKFKPVTNVPPNNALCSSARAGDVPTYQLAPSERPRPHSELRTGTLREVAVAITCEMWELWDYPGDDETLAELHTAVMNELALANIQITQEQIVA
jgi:hypothetical protein